MNKDLTMPIWVFVVLFTIAATFPLTIFAVKSWQFHQHQDEQIQMLKRQLEARQHHNFGVPSGLTERPASSHHISTFGASSKKYRNAFQVMSNSSMISF